MPRVEAVNRHRRPRAANTRVSIPEIRPPPTVRITAARIRRASVATPHPSTMLRSSSAPSGTPASASTIAAAAHHEDAVVPRQHERAAFVPADEHEDWSSRKARRLRCACWRAPRSPLRDVLAVRRARRGRTSRGRRGDRPDVGARPPSLAIGSANSGNGGSPTRLAGDGGRGGAQAVMRERARQRWRHASSPRVGNLLLDPLTIDRLRRRPRAPAPRPDGSLLRALRLRRRSPR